MLKRRQVLQAAGSTLATIGLSQAKIIQQGLSYGKVLAQNTPRKLALLVGVNTYSGEIPALQGCTTDVQLQRELLIHRFGFQPSDIQILTDAQATRQNIQTAFEQHLIRQAKPGDVVVFHFSGHGSLVLDPDPLPEFKGRNGTMVPIDRTLAQSDGTVRDIMGRSLFLWMYALQTESVTVVLDSCHSGGGIRGNVRFRAVPTRLNDGDAIVSPEELSDQRQWLSRLNLSSEQFQELRRRGIAKGVAIGSARYSQLAADVPFDGFSAGAFTYFLTRYLWQQSSRESLGRVFVNLAYSTKDVANTSGVAQTPVYATQPGSQLDQQPLYLLAPTQPAAEAVIQKVSGNQVEFWLGGVSSRSLKALEQNAVFTAIDSSGRPVAEIEQVSRQGLVGRGTLRRGPAAALKPGVLLREQVRGIPADLILKIGLDTSLGAVNPRSLPTLTRVEFEPLQRQRPVDYVLGRLTDDLARSLLASTPRPSAPALPPIGSVGLFTSSLVPVPDTFGAAGEAVPGAIERLRSRCKMLLAGRILQLVTNSDATGLKLVATLQTTGGSISRGRTAAPTGSRSRGAQEANTTPTPIATGQTLQPGTSLQIQIRNEEARSLYVAALVIGSNGDIVVLYPYWDSPEGAALVPNGQTLTVPQIGDQFTVQGPAGFLEVLIFASTEPLRNALRGLQGIARGRGLRSRSFLALEEDEPVRVVESLLSDLDGTGRSNSRGATQSSTSPTSTRQTSTLHTVRGVDSSRFAALSTVIEVRT